MLQQGSIFDNRYELVRLLGRGGFSEVWLAKDSYTRLDIAIKVYAPGQGMDTDGLVEFSQELAGVFNLNHPNLLKPTHVDAWEGMPYLILPFCSRGSIVKRVGKMSKEEIWKLIRDVASGLAYLHQQGIVHQDIKPDNILQDENGNYLITDFGISTKARSTLRKSVPAGTINAGTMAYMGPERFSKQPTPTRASDIWSFGAMLYELITGDLPFGEHGGGMQKNGAEIPDINEPVSDALKQMVEQMLALDKQARPTAEQVVELAKKRQGTVSPAETPKTQPVAEQTPQPVDERKTQRIDDRKTQRIEPIPTAPEKKEMPKEGKPQNTSNPKRKKRIIGWSVAAAVLLAVGLIIGLGVLKSGRTIEEEHVLIDGLYYNLYADNTAELVREPEGYNNYKDLKGNITIPSSIRYNSTTYAVTSIGAGAFMLSKGLTSITIPNSVTRIETSAFYGCTGLTSVTIPNSVTSIGGGAFYNCTGLTSPVYNEHVFAYLPLSYQGAYAVPKGISQIAGGAFDGCTGLTSVKIPNSVTSIGEWTFYKCTSLTSVTIPNSVTSIGDYAFSGCSGLKSVSIPKHTHVEAYAFEGCDQVQINYY